MRLLAICASGSEMHDGAADFATLQWHDHAIATIRAQKNWAENELNQPPATTCLG